MPQDWSEQPEARGPMTEPQPRDFQDGLSRWPESAGPVTDTSDTSARHLTYPRGRTVYDRSMAEIERERDADARRHELRQQVERAAMAAGMTAMQAAEAATKLQRQAEQTAGKVSQS